MSSSIATVVLMDYTKGTSKCSAETGGVAGIFATDLFEKQLNPTPLPL